MTVVYIVLAVVGIVGGRQVHVLIFPWKTCPRCKGGRQYSGSAHRDCARCGAKGRVRRVGAGEERS